MGFTIAFAIHSLDPTTLISIAVNALRLEKGVEACHSLASCMIFASYLSVRNTAIFCDYNFDPSPRGAEKTAEKPRQAL